MTGTHLKITALIARDGKYAGFAGAKSLRLILLRLKSFLRGAALPSAAVFAFLIHPVLRTRRSLLFEKGSRATTLLLWFSCLLNMGNAFAADAGSPAAANTAVATFAGGCFWCMEPPFDKLDGVISTTSGYTGGHVPDPDYEQVSAGATGHAEALQIVYDPAKVSFSRLLEVFWRNIDPLDAGGQFCDRGDQYRSAVFYHDSGQQQLAEQSKQDLQRSAAFSHYGKPVATQIVAATKFYPAEEYHQDYYKKNPIRYKFYRNGCGRDKVLDRYWKPKEKQD
jgi:peptide-methionine (S)-S-oxide reductase